jgi:hypothetical protein
MFDRNTKEENKPLISRAGAKHKERIERHDDLETHSEAFRLVHMLAFCRIIGQSMNTHIQRAI